MLARVALAVALLVIAAGAPAQTLWNLVGGFDITDAAVAADVLQGGVVLAWVASGEIETMVMEGDMIYGTGNHGAGQEPELATTLDGTLLAWADGHAVTVRRLGWVDWEHAGTIVGGGLPVSQVALTGWQAGVGHEFPDAYLCWVEADGGLWMAIWSAGSWSAGFPVGDLHGIQGQRPRALPVMTPGGIQPRVYYLEADALWFTEWSGAGWAAPQPVAAGSLFGVTFELAVGPGFSQHVLSLGPEMACPCNVIHYTHSLTDGGWLAPEPLTADVAEFDWPHDPSLGVGDDGAVHAFWRQEAYDGELQPLGETMHYVVDDGGGWADATSLLDGHLGRDCDLAMLGDEATLQWVEGEPGADNQIWLLTSLIVTGVGGVPPASVNLAAAPNPFNPATTFRCRIPGEGPASLRVFDATGRRVRTLLDGRTPSRGTIEIAWDGRDDAGRRLPSGVYVARLTVGNHAVARSVVLVK